jgi:hypothetical protein
MGHMTRPPTIKAHPSSQLAATKVIRRPLRQALGAAVVVAALGASASAASGATLPGQAAARLHGGVNVTIWSIDSDGADFHAILSGAIGDYGPAVTVLPDGKVDPEHTSEMELELRHGTFRLYIEGIASKLRAEASDEPVYAATCSDYFHVTDTVPVVAGSGTGAYRGISGNFSLTLTGNEDQAKPCSTNNLLMVRQIVILDGAGTVSS